MEFIKSVLVGLLVLIVILIPIIAVFFIGRMLFGDVGMVLLPFILLLILTCYGIGIEFRN